MSEIARVHARQLLDSRGNPTVEVDVTLSSGRARARDRPVGRVHGRARSGRAARRRSGGVPRQGRARGGRQRERRDRRRARRARRRRPARARRCSDRAGRHADEEQARRQRDPGLLARLCESSRGRCRRTSVSLARRPWREHPSRADAERDQRRRSRAESARPPGVHGGPCRARTRSPRRCASAPRSFTR